MFLLLEKMSGEARRNSSLCSSFPHFIHQLGIELDVLLSLLKYLRFPRGKDAGDVFEGGVAFDGILSWNTEEIKG